MIGYGSRGLPNYLEDKLAWRRSSKPRDRYDGEFDGERCVVRLNDFPEDHLYTLLVDQVEVTSFDD